MKRSSLLALLCSLSFTTAALAAPPVKPTKPPVSEPGQQAQALFRDGKYTEAMRAYEEAITARRNAEVKDQRQYATLLLGYGRALAAQRKYDEALRMLTQASAIAEAFVLPAEFAREVEVEINVVRPRATQPNRNPHIFHSNSYYSNENTPDAAEQEHVRKAAIEYTRARFGGASIAYLLRNLEYARFLSQQQRPDDLGKQADLCRGIFSKMTLQNQAQTAAQVIDFAQSLADNNLPLQADTIGSIVLDGISAGSLPNAIDTASKVDRLASALERRQNPELAQKYYAAAVRGIEKQVPADDPRLAKMRTALADFYHKVGKNGAAIELLELSVAAQQKNIATGSADALNALASLTELYCIAGNLPKAKASAEALATALTQNTEELPIPFKSLLSTAVFLAGKNDIASAEKVYTAAFSSLQRNRQRISDYDVQQRVKELAISFGQKGYPDQAEKVYDAIIQARYNQLGQPTSATASAYLDKAQFFLEQESYDKAGPAALKAVELGKRFPNNESRFYDLARQFEEKKQYDTALGLIQAWISNAEGNRNINDYQVVEARTKIAKIYHAQGKNAEAEKEMKSVSEMVANGLPPSLVPIRPICASAVDRLLADNKYDLASDFLTALSQSHTYQHSADVLSRISYSLMQPKLYAECEQVYKLALELHTTAHGPSSTQVAQVMRDYARLLELNGQPQKASEMMKTQEAIFALYTRQNQTNPGGSDFYKPFAPVSETIAAAANLKANTNVDMNITRFPRLPISR